MKLFKRIALFASLLVGISTLAIADSGWFLGSSNGGQASPTYTNATPTPVTIGGINSGSTFTAQTMSQMWTMLLYPYIAPGITLTGSPSPGTFEHGNPQSPVVLTPTLTTHTNPITAIVFKRSANGGSYSTIHSQGGVSTPYSDGTSVGSSNTVQYEATASDGTATTISNILTFTYVYPFYYGVYADGLTGNDLRTNLTDLVQIKQNYVATVSPNSNRVYYCYPASYGSLTHIYDINGFDVLSSFTKSTENITGLDSTVVSYYVYEINYDAGDGSATTFNFEF